MSDPFEGLFDSGEVLERVGVNLTTQARRGDLEPVRCRDAEIARVVDILLRQSKNNPALIGKAGVGKTAIVEGLAQRVAAGDVPPALKDVRVVALDHVALLAGTSFRGQDDARRWAIVPNTSLTPEGASPHKAIDMSDEACAHAQAIARVSPELDRMIRERRKVDAMTRRGLTHEQRRQEPAEDLMAEIFPMLERIGAEIEKMLGGEGRSKAVEGGGGVTADQPPPSSTAVHRPPPSLADRRAELDQLLRAELEHQGIVVSGQDVARVVGAAVGKGIEWQAWFRRASLWWRRSEGWGGPGGSSGAGRGTTRARWSRPCTR